jgi:hypothetical protein
MIPSVLSYDEINQILVYQSEYGARVNIQNGMLISTESSQQRNEAGKYYNRLFSLDQKQASKYYPNLTRIVNMETNEVLFEGLTPEFTKVFYDRNVGAFVLIYDFISDENDIWVINIDGKVIYKGKYIDELYEVENMPQNEISQSAVYIKPQQDQFSQALDALNVFDSNQELAEENEVEENDAEVKEEEAEEEKITITGCGWPPELFEKILSVEIDQNEKLTGFSYYKNNEIRFFNAGVNADLNEQLELSIESELNFTYPAACIDSNVKSNLHGRNYSRWCQDDYGLIKGKVELWSYEEALIESEYIEHFKNTYPISGNLIQVGKGQYENGMKQGVWSFLQAGHKNLIACHYDRGLLEGVCREDDGEYYDEKMFAGNQINGWAQVIFKGELEERCHYKNGYKQGECAAWEDGKLYEQCYFNGESLIGYCSEYYTDDNNQGALYSECEMLGRMNHGHCTFFKEDGNVERKIEYSRGVEVWEEIY